MKKRLALSILTIAAISLIVSAATFALFSASTDNVGNTFTAGTVTLGQPVNTLVNVSPLAPGDSGTAGSFKVTYTGNLQAWLGLDTVTSGDLFGGTKPLTVTIRDSNNKTYNGNGANQVVGKVTGQGLSGEGLDIEGVDGEVVDGEHNPPSYNIGRDVTFTVSYNMPLAAGNEYQGKTGTVSLKVHAVQARNNTNTQGNGPTNWQ